MLIELDPVDRITAGAVGPPGSRVFFLQGRRGPQLVTLLVEKQQVQLIAAWVLEMLSRIGRDVEEGPPEADMDLEEPLEPEWQAGRLALGYDEERDLLFLEAEEAVPEAEEDAVEGEPGTAAAGGAVPDSADEPARVRFWASPEQMLALARHGAAVAAAGRPLCEFCGNPMEPEGHQCPALNGHGEVGEA